MTMPMSTGAMATPVTSTSSWSFEFTKPSSTAGMGDTDTGDMGNGGNVGNSMGNMNMGNSIGSCNISMLWNWDTIDTCFLSESWQIKSSGGFAGLCIGVILLGVLLELLRRLARTYDQHLVRSHRKTTTALAATSANSSTETASGSLIAKEKPLTVVGNAPYRPTPWQQSIRALLHTLQFALGYWIMLLAMYYNGYIIICIFLGAFVGFFAFQWEQINYSHGNEAGAAISQGVSGCHN
ncbi:Ctr-domain-containing protein [Hypoxylon sp. FL1150]|nr:Ctr-domain-containing protein [Hypoxylon sp. FL1150]